MATSNENLKKLTERRGYRLLSTAELAQLLDEFMKNSPKFPTQPSKTIAVDGLTKNQVRHLRALIHSMQDINLNRHKAVEHK